MKIFVADLVFEEAHKDMNVNFLRAIDKFAELTVISANRYYEKIDEELPDVDIVNVDIDIKRGFVSGRLASLKLMLFIEDILKKKQFDSVIILCFETTCMSFGKLKTGSVPIILFHHRNIDELTNLIKRRIFIGYKDYFYHVVFEDFFGEHLVKDFNVDKNRLYIIPHPARRKKLDQNQCVYDCVGLCNSNDESFIDAIIDNDEKFVANGLKVLLRSKRRTYKGRGVETINGYLEKEKYDEIINSASSIFVPFQDGYIYRLSGSIYDGLSREKLVFTTSKFYTEDYTRRYPGVCFHVETVDELIEGLKKHRRTEKKNFECFLADHSIEMVSCNIEMMVNKILRQVE